jgi:hypothetical protein
MSNNPSSRKIQDSDLLAYLEGTADPIIRELVEHSDAYQKRIRELTNQQRVLKTQLYRRSCPSTDQLDEYFLGTISKQNKHEIDEHLQKCPYCTRELVQYEVFLDKSKLAPSWVDRIKIVVAQLLDNQQFNSFQPALAVRGSEVEPIIYEGEGILVALNIQDDVAHPGRKSVVGFIVGMEEELIQAHLWQGGQHHSIATVSDSGNFSIDSLLPGTYELIVKSPYFLVHIQTFTI